MTVPALPSLKERGAVSPVIGVVLMVAVTVLISGVLLVLVLNLMEPDDVSPSGVMDVSPTGEDSYGLSVIAMTFSIDSTKVKLSVNGIEPPGSVSSYTVANPFTHGLFSYSIQGQQQPATIGTGSGFLLTLDQSLRGETVRVTMMTISGAVIADVAFIALGEPPLSTIPMGNAEFSDGSPADFPLQFVRGDGDYVTVPQSDIGTIDESVQKVIVNATVTLGLPPSEQARWASIVNLNGNDGIRLQLSGVMVDEVLVNDNFEFGTSGGFVRSDAIREGVEYTVRGEVDIAEGKVRIFVNNTHGVMVMHGERDSGAPEALGDWHLGAFNQFGQQQYSRHFDGEISRVAIEIV